jgi:hypothetical protein
MLGMVQDTSALELPHTQQLLAWSDATLLLGS